MHFRRHRIAFLRGADQFGSHRFNFLGCGFMVAHHGLCTERADTRDAILMLDVVRHRIGLNRWCAVDWHERASRNRRRDIRFNNKWNNLRLIVTKRHQL